MTSAPNELTETPNPGAADAVEDILSAMRLSGGIFVDAEFRGDFSVASHFVPDQCALYFPVTGSLIGYHFVEQGELWFEIEGAPPQKASAGSVVVFPRNDPHRLFNADVPTVSSQSLFEVGDASHAARLRYGKEEDEAVRLYCGFVTAASEDNPLLDRLPGLLVLEPANDLQGKWLEASLRFAMDSRTLPTSDIGRLAEVVIRESLRDHLRRIADEQPHWLDGLRDRFVARALAVIHRRYPEDLDVDQIAREVGLSRSGLNERFVATMGEPPMRYCARWRMRQAANLLRETDDNSATIAFAVGFNSEAAFNRAFKREYGEPPASWRRRKAEQLTPARPFEAFTAAGS
jgi:AraC-like DNA-binding protein